MKLGVDLSILDELNELNPKFIYQGQEIEPFHFFSEHSHIAMVRIRLWHHPYDKDGNPYGGGTNDLECFMRLAKKAQKEGMSILLDFHYSDFWVDPSRQKLPKAWEGKNFPEILEALEQYTRNTLLRCKEEGIDIRAIQVGNEITHGMVFPFGELEKEFDPLTGGGFKGHALLFKAGYKACKEIYPEAKVICHLEHAGSKDMQQWYLDNLINEGVEFDAIGESYYPYWHGPFKDLKDNLSNLNNRYHKPIWIMEMGYEYAESLVEGHHAEYKDMEGDDFVVGNIDGRVPFPPTKEGQAEYIKKILKIYKELGVEMVFYWEPAWILLPNNGWAKEAGQIYCGLEPTKAYNDWANETLFDFNGEANPAVEYFTQQYVDSLDEE